MKVQPMVASRDERGRPPRSKDNPSKEWLLELKLGARMKEIPIKVTWRRAQPLYLYIWLLSTCFLWIDWNSNLLVGIYLNWLQFWSNKNYKTSNGCCEFRMLIQSPSKESRWNVLLESHKKNNTVVYFTWDPFFLSSLHGGGWRGLIAQYNSCQMCKLLTTSSSSLHTLKTLL